MTTPEELITKAKIQILQESTFFSSLLFSLETVILDTDPTMTTAATDGEKVYINSNFLASITPKQLIGLILHEVLHVALDSFGRRGSRDSLKWNYATDYKINETLTDTGFELPPGSLLSDKYIPHTAEKVYTLLLQNPESEPQWGKGDILKPADPAKTSQKATEMLAQAQTACDLKDAGNEVPSSIRKHIDELLNPVLPWNVILTNFMNNHAKDDYSWQRPNRRHLPDFYLPSMYSETIKHVVVAIDTSGSITRKEEVLFLTEIENIRQTFDIDQLTLYAVSTSINNKFEIQQSDNLLDLKFGTSIGTDFKSFFNKIAQQPPTVLIFFSDLYVKFNWKPPNYQVIWISTEGLEAPLAYGHTILLNQ